MIWPPTLEMLRQRIGLEPDDDTMDELLVVALETSLAHVELYLDRKLLMDNDEETFIRHHGEILVRRYPISWVDSIAFYGRDGTGYFPTTEVYYDVDYEKGIVYNISNRGVPFVKMAYTGGYEDMPSALYWAIMAVFDSVWISTPGLGGGGGGAIVTEGAVKKISLVGIGSVDLDTGSSSVSGGSSGGGGLAASPWGVIPATQWSVLDLYRRESAVGVG